MCKLYQTDQPLTGIALQSHDQEADWTVISRHFTDNTVDVEDYEVEEQESEDDEQPTEATTGTTTPLTRPQIIVNIPRCRDNTQTRAKSHTVLNKLNSMASKAIQCLSPQRKKVVRRRASRLWSTDSESDSGGVTSEKLESRGPKPGHHSLQPCSTTPSSSSNTTNPPQLTGINNDNDDDWDLIDKDLEESFSKSYPSAAKKVRTSYPESKPEAQSRSNKEEVLLSIEPTLTNNQFNQFTQELVAKASAVTPTPMPAPESPPSFSVYRHPIWKADYSTSTWHIDLTKSPATQVEKPKSNQIAITPQKRPLSATNEDDEFVVTGSGRRQRIRLPLRSLSVLEAEVIALD